MNTKCPNTYAMGIFSFSCREVAHSHQPVRLRIPFGKAPKRNSVHVRKACWGHMCTIPSQNINNSNENHVNAAILGSLRICVLSFVHLVVTVLRLTSFETCRREQVGADEKEIGEENIRS